MRRMLSLSCLIGALSMLASTPRGATAQVAWDVPSMIHPGAPSGLSILLVDAYLSDDLGALALWRSAAAPTGLGLRAGIAEGPGGDLAAMFGVDVSGTLTRLGSDLGEPGVLWWTGAGLGVGDELLASFPLGIVLGWRVSEDQVTFMPYLGGHMSLDVITGPGDDLDLDGSVDLGLDLGFGSGLMARFGASVGGRDGFGVGVRLPS